MTKQDKGARTTALRAAARRAKIGHVVMVLADRNRKMPWKVVCAEAGRLCGVGAGAVSKMSDVTWAFRFMRQLLSDPRLGDQPIFPPDFDLDAFIRDGDHSADFAGVTQADMPIALALMRGVPPMQRGRKPRY